MSNLKLPNLSYKELSKLPEGKQRKIAYATHALNQNGRVIVYHHHHPIGVIEKNKVLISKCGYNSNTTTHRLDRILLDNFGYESSAGGVRVCKRNYVTGLSYKNLFIGFETATIHRNGEVEVKR